MAEELNPCPFCNGAPALSFDDCAYYCIDCGCMPYVEIGDEPAEVWNRRVEPIGNPDELPDWFVEKINERRFKLEKLFNNDAAGKEYIQALELLWVLTLRRDE